MAKGESKLGGGGNGIIESGSYAGVSRNVLKQAIDNNVETLVANLNEKYKEGASFKVGGNEYTVTDGANFTVDEQKRVRVSFTGERQTKAENITTTFNAVLLAGDGVNAAKMGFVTHKETRKKR